MNISEENTEQSSWTLIAIIICIVLGVFLAWQFLPLKETEVELTQAEIVEPINKDIELDALVPIIDEVKEPILNEEKERLVEDIDVMQPEVIELPPKEDKKPTHPSLDESDTWIQEKLASIIWRKELIDLIINEDMVRRMVVFVDNFAQGNVSYKHSPFVKPLSKFSVLEESNQNAWEIDEQSFKRYTRYVDLLRSVDTDTLVEWYVELEPLISEAYAELGYPDEDFTDKLQLAITKVLDVEIPKGKPTLIRPSVMYRYENESLESLDAAEKLLLRLGKDNLLVIKSVLLEINEKLDK